MFSLFTVTEKARRSLSLSLHTPSLSFHPNWLPVWRTSCRTERKLWLQSSLSGGGRRMYCLPGWAEQRGSGKYLSGLLSVSVSPLLLSPFLSYMLQHISSSSSHSALSSSSSLICQGDGQKASPWQIVKSCSLSSIKKLKCLSQLLGMKWFGEALGCCNSNGLVILPECLF